MNAAIQSGDARLFGCSPETREGARLYAITFVRGLSLKAKFSPNIWVITTAAAPDCVLWPLGYSGNGGVFSSDSHFGSDGAADIGHGPQQVVLELAVPAADESIGLRDAKPRQHINALIQRHVIAFEDLQRNGNPVSGRSRRQHRIVSPEPRNGPLFRCLCSVVSQRPQAPPCRTRTSCPRCRQGGGGKSQLAPSAWRMCGSCPSLAEAVFCWCATRLVGTQLAAPLGNS